MDLTAGLPPICHEWNAVWWRIQTLLPCQHTAE